LKATIPTTTLEEIDTLHFNPLNIVFKGNYTVPGDKSISHRALILGSIFGGQVTIKNLNGGEDVHSTLAALEEMGVKVISKGAEGLVIQGPQNWLTPSKPLDMGNSGTSTRLLMGLVAGAGVQATFKGDASLSKRPMARVIDPLVQMGMPKPSGENLPLTVPPNEKKLLGIDYIPTVASAQVKSAILIGGLFAKGPTRVTEIMATRDHTERMMGYMGMPLETQGHRIQVREYAPQRDAQITVDIPGDPSSAAFWVVGALITPHSKVTIENVLMNPFRVKFLEYLLEMGGQIEVEDLKVTQGGEEVATLKAHYSPNLRAIETDPVQAPAALIDEFPILAVAASFADGQSSLQNLGELRFKESDRLFKIGELLRAFGISFEITQNEQGGESLIVHGRPLSTYTPLGHPITYSSQGDHRMAMSALIMAAGRKTPLRLEGVKTINTSFPTFLEQLGVG
jgi:3-phosphoshikimate 1-carboxyvinyltransferase